MSTKRSLDKILESFKTGVRDDGPKSYASVSIRVPGAAKERYDRIQASSGRRFSKIHRELFLAALDEAEAEAS